MNGRQTISFFNKYGVIDYIVSFYGALHTTGPEYIVKDIDEMVAERDRQLYDKYGLDEGERG
jgi:hypothetical protein